MGQSHALLLTYRSDTLDTLVVEFLVGSTFPYLTRDSFAMVRMKDIEMLGICRKILLKGEQMKNFLLTILLTLVVGNAVAHPDEVQFAPIPYSEDDLVTPNRVVGDGENEALVYRRPGANPCRPEAGCTKEWAVAEAVKAGLIPAHIAPKLIDEVRNGKHLAHAVKYGETFWMTEGATPEKRRFSPLARASWSGKCKTYSAMHWFVLHNRVSYHIMKIDAGGNWAGWKAGPINILIDTGARLSTLGKGD